MVADYRTQSPLCLNLLTYVAPLSDVDTLLGAHASWLEDRIANGLVLLAGRRTPRTGGVMLIRGSAEQVAAIAATDPFIVGGVATNEIHPFTATFANPAIGDLLR